MTLHPLPKIKFPGPTPSNTNQYPAVARLRLRVVASETHSDDGAGTPSAEFNFDHEWTLLRTYSPATPADDEFSLTEGAHEPADWNLDALGSEWTDAGGFVITDGVVDPRDLMVTPTLARIAAALVGAPLPRPTSADPSSSLTLSLALAFSGAQGNWSLTLSPFSVDVDVPNMPGVRVPPFLVTDSGSDTFTYLGIGTITVSRSWSTEIEFLGP